MFLVKIERYFYFIFIMCFHAPYILIYAILYFLYGYSVSSTFKSYNCWRFDITIVVLNINAIVGKVIIYRFHWSLQYKDPINKTFELIHARTILYLQGSGIFPQIPQILHCSSYGSVYANWIYSGKCQRLAYLQV